MKVYSQDRSIGKRRQRQTVEKIQWTGQSWLDSQDRKAETREPGHHSKDMKAGPDTLKKRQSGPRAVREENVKMKKNEKNEKAKNILLLQCFFRCV
jgi:hypothetical protein